MFFILARSQDALSVGAWHRGENLEVFSQQTCEPNFTQESPRNTRVKFGSKAQKALAAGLARDECGEVKASIQAKGERREVQPFPCLAGRRTVLVNCLLAALPAEPFLLRAFAVLYYYDVTAGFCKLATVLATLLESHVESCSSPKQQ